MIAQKDKKSKKVKVKIKSVYKRNRQVTAECLIVTSSNTLSMFSTPTQPRYDKVLYNDSDNDGHIEQRGLRRMKEEERRREREANEQGLRTVLLHNPTVYNYPHILSRRPSGGLQGATSFIGANFSKLKLKVL